MPVILDPEFDPNRVVANLSRHADDMRWNRAVLFPRERGQPDAGGLAGNDPSEGGRRCEGGHHPEVAVRHDRRQPGSGLNIGTGANVRDFTQDPIRNGTDPMVLALLAQGFEVGAFSREDGFEFGHQAVEFGEANRGLTLVDGRLGFQAVDFDLGGPCLGQVLLGVADGRPIVGP